MYRAVVSALLLIWAVPAFAEEPKITIEKNEYTTMCDCPTENCVKCVTRSTERSDVMMKFPSG